LTARTRAAEAALAQTARTFGDRAYVALSFGDRVDVAMVYRTSPADVARNPVGPDPRDRSERSLGSRRATSISPTCGWDRASSRVSPSRVLGLGLGISASRTPTSTALRIVAFAARAIDARSHKTDIRGHE
jgi:hypothetical protein